MNSNEAENTPETPIKEGKGCCHGGRRRFWKVPFIIAAIVLIKSALILFLWNEVVPELFHGPMINYLQAIELAVLAKLLVGFHGFRGFGGHRFGGHGFRGHWAHLSPEEREKMREEMRKRWGRR